MLPLPPTEQTPPQIESGRLLEAKARRIRRLLITLVPGLALLSGLLCVLDPAIVQYVAAGFLGFVVLLGVKHLWPKLQLVATLTLVLSTFGWWFFLRPPSDDPPETTGIRSVRVWQDGYGDKSGEPPVVDTDNVEAIHALTAVLQKAEEHQDHKCGSVGVIQLRRSFGRSERLEFLPGHSPEWYEFRYGGKAYRVPRAEFIAAMRQIGVEVPLVDR